MKKKSNNNNYYGIIEGITFLMGVYGANVLMKVHEWICNMSPSTFTLIGLVAFAFIIGVLNTHLK